MQSLLRVFFGLVLGVSCSSGRISREAELLVHISAGVEWTRAFGIQ